MQNYDEKLKRIVSDQVCAEGDGAGLADSAVLALPVQHLGKGKWRHTL